MKSPHKKRTCRDWRRFAERALDDRLSLELELALEEHLAECPRCAAHRARAQVVEELLERVPEPPVERLDVDAAVRAVRARTAGTREPQPLWWRVPVLAAAAVLALASAFAWRALSRPSGSPGSPGAMDPLGPHDDVAVSGAGSSAQPAPDRPDTAEPATAEPAADPLDAIVRRARSRAVAVVGHAPDVDPDRLSVARAEIRATLLEHADAVGGGPPGSADLEGDAVERAARDFERAVAEEIGGGWPLRRHVADLVDDEDLALARAAVRYLGARGDRLTLPALARAFDRPELELAATRALLDASRSGAGDLALALRHPSAHAALLEGLREDEHESAAQRAAEVLRQEPRDRREPLARLLAQLGPPGLRELVDLGDDRALDRDLCLELLDERAEAVVVARLEGRDALSLDWSLALCERLTPADALGWVGERAVDGRTSERAWVVLSAYSDAAAIEEAVRAWRVRDLAIEPFAAMIARAPGASSAVVADWDRRAAVGDPDAGRLAEDYLELLAASKSPAAAPALAALAASTVLAPDDRVLAAASIGELERGGSAAPAELVWLVAQLGPDDRRLAAACVLSIHRIEGPDGVRAALPHAPDRSLAKTLDLCGERSAADRTATSLVRLARALEPLLEDTAGDRSGSTSRRPKP